MLAENETVPSDITFAENGTVSLGITLSESETVLSDITFAENGTISLGITLAENGTVSLGITLAENGTFPSGVVFAENGTIPPDMFAENGTVLSDIMFAENGTVPSDIPFAENGTVQAYGEEPIRFPVALMQTRAFLIALFMVVGVVGNLLTMVAVARCPRLHNATTAFIVSLCVADLMFCLLVMPPEIFSFSEMDWLRGDGALCVLQTFFEYICVAGSLFSITLITFNRFVLIVFPSAYHRLYQRQWVAAQIVTIWVFSFIMLLPTLTGNWGRFGYQPRLRSCAIVPVDGRSSNTTLFIIGFLVPCASILVCYIPILAAVMTSNAQQRRHHDWQETQQRSRRAQRQRQNEMHITKMALAVFLAFLTCYSPLIFANLADPKYNHPEWHVAGYVMICVSGCVNPIIYVTLSRQYRQAYRALLVCRPARHGSDSSSTEVTRPASRWLVG